MIKIKRVYEAESSDDGYRVLVDRLWPRGESKVQADLDIWLKDVAPSTELRKWFGHDPDKFDEFARRYRAELSTNPAVDELRSIIVDHDTVTLLYGAKDTKHNQAVVLQQYLDASSSGDA